MKTFRCQLVTPNAKLLDEQVTYANVPAWDGLFGVMPGRAPMLAQLGLGELTVQFPDSTGKGGDRSYVIDGGFVKMAGDTLTVLAEAAFPAEELTESDAKAELATAQGRTVPTDAPDLAAASDRLARDRERAALKLRVAQRVRGKGI